jgi:golgi apparatus protein 1
MIVTINNFNNNYIADIMCLQNALQDSNKSLQPDCYKMLTTRMEMFKNAAKVSVKYHYTLTYIDLLRFFIACFEIIAFSFIALQLIAPNTFEELYSTMNRSPARRYFLIVGFTMIGLIFIFGMFCGRVTRRTMIMKNKWRHSRGPSTSEMTSWN